MSRRPFGNFKNKTLVESGSFCGDGIQQALDDNFERVISFEVSKELYEHCRKRFQNDARVELIYASSATHLFDRVEKISEPITFWLDGHFSSANTSFDPDHVCPLMLELEQIAKHPIKTHTILIDDRRLMIPSKDGGKDGHFDVSEAEVVAKIKEINSNYTISYLNGHVENDIIVARIE